MRLRALREAGEPLRAAAVARYAMLATGLPADDCRVNEEVTDRIRIALGHLAKRGVVRRVVVAPDTWWELAG